MRTSPWGRFWLLAIVGPLSAVLGLVALDVLAVLLHAYGWVPTATIEMLLLVLAIDIVGAFALLGLLVGLAVARCPWPGLLAVTLALLATIGLTAFNMMVTATTIQNAG